MAAVPSIGRASLVEASRSATAAAATEGLYERHAAKIHSYCLHRLRSREEAEDAVQTTFMNAFRALGRGVVPEAEAAWLYKIAENVCLSRHRSSWRRGRLESPAEVELVEHVVPAPDSSADELIGLEDALAAMPEQQRRAILLREWQGLSYREIADELDLSQSAVETLIFRARRSLAQGLEQAVAPKRRLRRLLHALDLAPLVGALKALLAGGAAVKSTAAVVAVTAAVSVGGSTPQTAPTSPPKVPSSTVTSPKQVVAPAPPADVRAESPRDVAQAPSRSTAAKAKAATRTPLGQTRTKAASQGKSVVARTRPAPPRGAPKGQAARRGRSVPPAVAPPRPAPKPTSTPPQAATFGGSRAAAAREK